MPLPQGMSVRVSCFNVIGIALGIGKNPAGADPQKEAFSRRLYSERTRLKVICAVSNIQRDDSVGAPEYRSYLPILDRFG